MPESDSQFETVDLYINVYPHRPDKPHFVVHTNEENAARSRRKDVVCVIHLKGAFKRGGQYLVESVPF